MKRLALIISIFFMGQSMQAQLTGSNSENPSSDWTRNDIFRNNVFIENKGQFDKKDKRPASKILFGVFDNGMQIFFTSKGLTYRYDKAEIPEKMIEEIEKKRGHKNEANEEKVEKEIAKNMKTISYTVNFEWLGSNPNVKLVAENMVSQYYTYGDEKKSYKASAYKKLIYKGLYTGIDVEYIFHEKEGVKYSILVHPGADVSKVKMKYSGADKIKKDELGNIHLVIALGDIIDHAPITFYESDKTEIASSFSVINKTVGFNLKNYDDKSSIVIDPWTVGITMNTSNQILEVERDNAGNIYILGGPENSGIPMLLKKYNSAGSLLWTYTPVTVGFSGRYGDDLKIDKSGNVYILAGYGAQLFKVNSLGIPIWANAALGGGNRELYRLLFDCDNSNPFVTSGEDGGAPNQALYINPGTGNTSSTVQPIFNGAPNQDDLRDLVLAPNGNYYGITVGNNFSTPNSSKFGSLTAFSPSLNNSWSLNHGYPLLYWTHYGKFANQAAAIGQPGSVHLIAVSKNYIYTTSGSVLNKRNLANGTIIGSTIIIPGGVLATSANGNSGIVLDTCENIYVSSGAGVYKYDSNLNFIASATTPGAVYDICLGITGEVIACGDGFLSSLNLSACVAAPLNVSALATPSGNCNNGNVGTVTALPTGGNPSYNYYWIPGGQTTKTVTGLGAGTYSVIVADMNCNKDTAIVTVSSSGALITSITQTNLQCYGASNGSTAVTATNGTPSYTYLWSTGNTGAAITGLSAGTYIVTVTDANACSSVKQVSISQPSQMTVAITTLATTCNSATGNATVTVSGSSGPYTYLWATGSTSIYANRCGTFNAGCQGIISGTYTVTIRDSNGCTQTSTATVPSSTNPADPSFTQSPSGTICIGTTVNFINTGSTGTYSWTITPANVSGTTTDFSYTFLTAGTYNVRHTVTNGGCTNALTSPITIINCTGPIVTATGSSVCLGSCATVTSYGSGGANPYIYSWNNGATTQNISPCPASTTTYTVTIKDTGGNTATSTAVVTVNPAVTVTISATNINCNGGTGSASAQGGSGTSPYVYNWSNGQATQTITGLAAGNYTVTVTDAKSCTTATNALIISPPSLLGQFTKGTANCTGCGCKEWIMITASGGTDPYSYSWPTSAGHDKRYLNHLCPGTYTINIKDKNGCGVTVNLTAP
ncbi:MAG: hypothetical protein HYU69_06380 [Bacteroidetes bacterium]|nr:hypothetical protein [Bacteroidota bacterium]